MYERLPSDQRIPYFLYCLVFAGELYLPHLLCFCVPAFVVVLLLLLRATLNGKLEKITIYVINGNDL